MTTPSRSGAIARARAYFDSGAYVADLTRRVAFRTESQRVPDSLPELQRYLTEEMRPRFEAMGFSVELFDNPVPGYGPVLLATRIEDEKLPTVLGYGHGDVIRGQEEMWTKGQGPWIAHRDGDKLYGRGTADNKGQHTVNMGALKAVMDERGGKLGFNTKFMIEMGEEGGSKGLKQLVEANKRAFSADVLIASDGPRAVADRPTLTLGARGALNFNLVCDLHAGGHHSGNWGGLIANPGIVLAHAIASLVGPKGELLVEELKAPPPSAAVKEALADLVVDGGDDAPDIDPDWGEPGMLPPERVYASNVFNVLAYTTGTPDKPVNAIPPRAIAYCQLRFIAGTPVTSIVPAIERHLVRNGFSTVKVAAPPAANEGGFAATRTEPDNPWAQLVQRSIARSSNAKPAVVPQMGGSICNDIFTDTLGMPALWMPHSYAGCSQHAPDEHLLLPIARSGLELMAGIYWDIGESGRP